MVRRAVRIYVILCSSTPLLLSMTTLSRSLRPAICKSPRTSLGSFNQFRQQSNEDGQKLQEANDLKQRLNASVNQAQRFRSEASAAKVALNDSKQRSKIINNRASSFENQLIESRRQVSHLEHELRAANSSVTKVGQELARLQNAYNNRESLDVVRRLLTTNEGEVEDDPSILGKPEIRLWDWTFKLSTETYGKEEHYEQLYKSLVRHERYVRDPSILCIYTDGAKFSPGSLGASAVVMSIPYAKLARVIPVQKHKVELSNVFVELEGIVLALEVAAEVAKPRQEVVVFTDCTSNLNDDIKKWLEDPRIENRGLERAAKALIALEARGCSIKAVWLGKDGDVLGSRFAHILARKATGLPHPHSMIMSHEAWNARISKESLESARHEIFVSDVG